MKKKTKRIIGITSIILFIILILGIYSNSNVPLTSSSPDFANPTWARLECSPTDAWEGRVDITSPSTSGIMFECQYNTDECRVFIDATGPVWWSGKVKVYYRTCQSLTGCTSGYQSFDLSAGTKDYEIPQTIAPGKYMQTIMEKCIAGICLPFGANPNTKFDGYVLFRPWKIYRWVGAQKTIAKSSDCCFVNAYEDFKDQIPTIASVPACLTFTGGEGSKWVNYVDSWVKGYAENIYNHPTHGEVYCSGGRIYTIVTLTTKDGKLTKIDPSYINQNPETTQYVARGMGNQIIDSSIECCPQEPNCGMDFKKTINPPKSCFSDVQCYNGGGPVPIDNTHYKNEYCSSGFCKWSEVIEVECTDNSACPAEKPICDLSTSNYGHCVTSNPVDYCGDGVCNNKTESKTNCRVDCGEIGINCTLTSIEQCNDKKPDGSYCLEEDCTSCGWNYEEPSGLFSWWKGGKCIIGSPLPKCESCDAYALSYIFGDLWKSKKCDSKGWSLEFSFFFIQPPQNTFSCGLSLIKLFLVPIVFIFSLLFLLDYLENFRNLKGKNKRLIRFILGLIIAGITSYLVYTIFIFGLAIFVIIILIKIGIKKIIP